MSSDEWYTPPEIVELARDVMGSIDLDPASCAEANEIVKAGKYFTKEDDGLSQEWFGNIFLNPPYSKEAGGVGKWSRKLITSISRKNHGVLVCNSRTETGWFQELLGCANAVCFPSKRIRFIDPDGKKSQPRHSNAIFYFGGESMDFVNKFILIGQVLEL